MKSNFILMLSRLKVSLDRFVFIRIFCYNLNNRLIPVIFDFQTRSRTFGSINDKFILKMEYINFATKLSLCFLLVVGFYAMFRIPSQLNHGCVK